MDRRNGLHPRARIYGDRSMRSPAYKTTFAKQTDFAALCVAFRHCGTELAEAASRVIDSVTDPSGYTDGFHRLALAVSEWYKTIADERQLKS